MTKRLLIILLVLVFCCSTAVAENSFRIECGIHQEDSAASVSMDAGVFADRIRILSDLFPDYCLFLPADEKVFSALLSDDPVFPSFTPADIPDRLNRYVSGLDCPEISGFFSGDAFSEASVLKEIRCDGLSLLSDLSEIMETGGSLSSFSSLFSFISGADPASLSILFRVYDSGDYLSMTGLSGSNTVFTLSADFSVKDHHRIVWGYPENSRNYYWQIDIDYVSDKKIDLETFLFSDAEKAGFRQACTGVPVLNEKWSFSISSDSSEMSLDGMIIPSSKSTAFITGSSAPDRGSILSAEMRFADVQDTVYSFSVQKEEKQLRFASLKEVSVSDPASSVSFVGFWGELSMKILPFYSSFIRSLPDEYRQVFLDIQ